MFDTSSQVAEVESWIGDRAQALQGGDYGKDEASSVKLLTKHKALELGVDTYSGIVQAGGKQPPREQEHQGTG